MKLVRMAVGTAAVVAALAVPVTASAGTTATQDFDRPSFGSRPDIAVDLAVDKAYAAAVAAGYTEAQCHEYQVADVYYLGEDFPKYQAVAHVRCTN